MTVWVEIWTSGSTANKAPLARATIAEYSRRTTQKIEVARSAVRNASSNSADVLEALKRSVQIPSVIWNKGGHTPSPILG